MYARPFIDSLDFARNGQQLSAEVSVAELPRLLDVLDDSQGVLRYTVRGGLDNQGNPVLDVSMDGQCRLRCQRCLNGLDYTVRLDSRLLLRDQAALDALDQQPEDEEEEFDSILADAHLDVLNMLEEEILLSLPIAPRHAVGACRAADSAVVKQEVKENPFAVLTKLKIN